MVLLKKMSFLVLFLLLSSFCFAQSDFLDDKDITVLTENKVEQINGFDYWQEEDNKVFAWFDPVEGHDFRVLYSCVEDEPQEFRFVGCFDGFGVEKRIVKTFSLPECEGVFVEEERQVEGLEVCRVCPDSEVKGEYDLEFYSSSGQPVFSRPVSAYELIEGECESFDTREIKIGGVEEDKGFDYFTACLLLKNHFFVYGAIVFLVGIYLAFKG